MKKIRNPKIFIGTHEIAGYYLNLTRGFKQLNHDVDFITYQKHPFNYGAETHKSFLLWLINWLNHFKGKSNRSFFIKII